MGQVGGVRYCICPMTEGGILGLLTMLLILQSLLVNVCKDREKRGADAGNTSSYMRRVVTMGVFLVVDILKRV